MNEKDFNFGQYFMNDTVNESIVWWRCGMWYEYGCSDNELVTIMIRVENIGANEWWRCYI